MLNEFVIKNTQYKSDSNNSQSTIQKLKILGNDSLFYFGLFLFALFLLNSLPFLGGTFDEINLGINEVLVSSLGLINVFFYKVYNRLFSKTI